MTNAENLPGYGMACDITLVPNDCPPGPELPRPTHHLPFEGQTALSYDYDAAMRMELDIYSVRWNSDKSTLSWAGGLNIKSII